eukprot:TRINITY_DN42607_c0_g1_i1.p1 TRINITY_DN42607_c0_g1~~TRINITY_DN42607_c0_g1_i1.p1  ORF type:complete len:380 (+),score=69.00 TRINITY_DN42607_c0_g1_i1:92-1141(+)
MWQNLLEEMAALRQQVQAMARTQELSGRQAEAVQHTAAPPVLDEGGGEASPAGHSPGTWAASSPVVIPADRTTRRRTTKEAATGQHSFRANARPRGESGDWTPLDGEDCYFEMLDAYPYKSELGFPYSLGPFKLLQTNGISAEQLEVFFDASDFDHASCESIAGGPARTASTDSLQSKLGWKLNSKMKLPPGSGDPAPGVLSALQDINLTDIARRAAGIPDEAKQYAWFYPIFPNMKAHSFDADLKFLKTGGYVFLDGLEPPKPLHICALELDLVGGHLLFGKPKRLSKDWSDHLLREGRFQPVTIDAFKEQGARYFCMMLNGEEYDGERICPKGGFAYRFDRDGSDHM